MDMDLETVQLADDMALIVENAEEEFVNLELNNLFPV